MSVEQSFRHLFLWGEAAQKEPLKLILYRTIWLSFFKIVLGDILGTYVNLWAFIASGLGCLVMAGAFLYAFLKGAGSLRGAWIVGCLLSLVGAGLAFTVIALTLQLLHSKSTKPNTH
eukprot:TRINITY_DN25421_c0_g1_i1.p1 TRINITY_DN25421_c0_g1~~TRINITY_DN25421_c0_g1_i1.p1  ORF type:complete len:117 (+),score=10.00 TRINITY_DN25421_c0_g1_i1:23-373(+)